jgi:hypothetical protein
MSQRDRPVRCAFLNHGPKLLIFEQISILGQQQVSASALFVPQK